ncbi:L-ascorbate 6-phosphate lactonase [Limosilactobacillus fermentum]|uniref:L-ascorbate 6-phosphate lactonase n=1 Tax=Limosilactobacillus fermentum TaxID=1613 RepID=UPI0020186C01|nr:L-ascorbate 6-phosphate lactonase [Limosilactobacillus fermentum]MCL3986615.1 L-ascorbate 6-phosphate lactonase [Limosilactobacillus fermentum]
MGKQVDEINEHTWKEEVFPEWGTWLNEEIDRTVVPQQKFKLWWLVNMGLWLKTDQQTNLVLDLWCGTGKQTHDKPDMGPRHQWSRLTGGRTIQPNLRAQPMVINPFAIKNLDVYLCTHFHHDHIDKNVAAAILQNVKQPVPFIGPQYVVDQWLEWGVPKDRCRVVKPGDKLTIKDLEITVTDSFDRSALISDPNRQVQPPMNVVPDDMDKRAVNYVIKTDAGTIYDAADSHYSAYFAKHGQDFDVDVAIVAYGDNPVGIQDKMTSIDVLRTAEDLEAKVVIPMHWDVWSNMLGDPGEVELLWRYRRHKFGYKFYPFAWLPGGHFTYPDDVDKLQYYHQRGFEDRYQYPTELPYRSFL